MEVWVNWSLGFLIWFGCILLLAILTFIIVASQGGNLRGKIPDDIFNYSYRPDFIPKDAFLFDSHSHTTASDGWMTPEQNIRWHIANGYNAFVLTDHNTGKNNQKILALQEKYPEIVIIPGFEWTNPKIHMNFLNIMDYPDKIPLRPSDKNVEDAINKAHELGAIVQIDHITWTLDRAEQKTKDYIHPTREQLLEWGADGFEINNEMRWYDPKTVYWLEKLKQEKKLKRPIFISTGTDIHNPTKEWATCWTELLLSPEEKEHATREIIMQALLEGRTKIWVDHDYRVSPEFKLSSEQNFGKTKILLAPFYALGHGIEKIPGGLKGILSYVGWFLIAYFPLRLIFQFIFQL